MSGRLDADQTRLLVDLIGDVLDAVAARADDDTGRRRLTADQQHAALRQLQLARLRLWTTIYNELGTVAR